MLSRLLTVKQFSKELKFNHILGLHMHPHTKKPGATLLDSWKDSYYLI
jgi:hypothetical protein